MNLSKVLLRARLLKFPSNLCLSLPPFSRQLRLKRQPWEHRVAVADRSTSRSPPPLSPPPQLLLSTPLPLPQLSQSMSLSKRFLEARLLEPLSNLLPPLPLSSHQFLLQSEPRQHRPRFAARSTSRLRKRSPSPFLRLAPLSPLFLPPLSLAMGTSRPTLNQCRIQKHGKSRLLPPMSRSLPCFLVGALRGGPQSEPTRSDRPPEKSRERTRSPLQSRQTRNWRSGSSTMRTTCQVKAVHLPANQWRMPATRQRISNRKTGTMARARSQPTLVSPTRHQKIW